MAAKIMDVISLLSYLRTYTKPYNELLESWRDHLPHTGKEDVMQGNKFLKWLEREKDGEAIAFTKEALKLLVSKTNISKEIKNNFTKLFKNVKTLAKVEEFKITAEEKKMIMKKRALKNKL